MPQARKNPVVFLALSPAMLAVALGLSETTVHAAITAGELGPVYVKGAKRRILVSDAEQWVRGWKQQSKRGVSHADA